MTTTDSVGIVGAGVSGLVQAIQFQRAGVQDVVLYEREGDVGGTWLVNTYPGLHCDIPSHLYSYSFEPNPEWSHVYADRAEIQARNPGSVTELLRTVPGVRVRPSPQGTELVFTRRTRSMRGANASGDSVTLQIGRAHV